MIICSGVRAHVTRFAQRERADRAAALLGIEELLQRELHLAIAESIRRSLEKAGVTEEEILEDFERFQRHRKASRRR